MTILANLASYLTPLSVSVAVLLSVSVKILYQFAYYRYFHPLSIFPGPFLGSFTRLWIAYHNYRSTELELEYALHKKYGRFLAAFTPCIDALH